MRRMVEDDPRKSDDTGGLRDFIDLAWIMGEPLGSSSIVEVE